MKTMDAEFLFFNLLSTIESPNMPDLIYHTFFRGMGKHPWEIEKREYVLVDSRMNAS